jgi:hypothetical protein
MDGDRNGRPDLSNPWWIWWVGVEEKRPAAVVDVEAERKRKKRRRPGSGATYNRMCGALPSGDTHSMHGARGSGATRTATSAGQRCATSIVPRRPGSSILLITRIILFISARMTVSVVLLGWVLISCSSHVAKLYFFRNGGALAHQSDAYNFI